MATELSRFAIERRFRLLSCGANGAMDHPWCRVYPAPFAKFGQKLFRSHKERIWVQDTANDDKRMGAHNVEYGVAAELPK